MQLALKATVLLCVSVCEHSVCVYVAGLFGDSWQTHTLLGQPIANWHEKSELPTIKNNNNYKLGTIRTPLSHICEQAAHCA